MGNLLSNNLSDNLSHNINDIGSHNFEGPHDNGNIGDTNSKNNSQNNAFNNQGNNSDNITNSNNVTDSHDTFNVAMPADASNTLTSTTTKFLENTTNDIHNVALDASTSLKSATKAITDIGNDAKNHMNHIDSQITNTANHLTSTADAITGTAPHMNSAADAVGAFSKVAQDTLERARQITSIAIQAGLTMMAVLVAKKLFDCVTSAEDPMLTAVKQIAIGVTRIADNTSAGVVNEECGHVLIRIRQICREHETKRVYLFIPNTIILRHLRTELADIKKALHRLQIDLDTTTSVARVNEIQEEMKTHLEISHELHNLEGWYGDIDKLLDEAVIDRLTDIDNYHKIVEKTKNRKEEAISGKDEVKELDNAQARLINGCLIFFYTPVPYHTKRILCIPPIGDYLIKSDNYLHNGDPLVYIGGILNTDRYGQTSRLSMERSIVNQLQYHDPDDDDRRQRTPWFVIPGDLYWKQGCDYSMWKWRPTINCEFGDASAYARVDHKTVRVAKPFCKEFSYIKFLGMSPVIPFIHFYAYCKDDDISDKHLIRAHRVPCGRKCKRVLNTRDTWSHQDCEQSHSVSRVYTKELAYICARENDALRDDIGFRFRAHQYGYTHI